MTETKGMMAMGNAEAILMRRRKAFELRQQGYNYEQIASAVIKHFGAENMPSSYSAGFAYRDVSALLRAYQQELREAASEVAWIELDRFDDMLTAVWPQVKQGDVKAIKAALEISRERRKLMGIDQDTINSDWRKELGELLATGAVRPEEIAEEFGDEVLSEILAYGTVDKS